MFWGVDRVLNILKYISWTKWN